MKRTMAGHRDPATEGARAAQRDNARHLAGMTGRNLENAKAKMAEAITSARESIALVNAELARLEALAASGCFDWGDVGDAQYIASTLRDHFTADER